mgnify:CR=1 FL=1
MPFNSLYYEYDGKTYKVVKDDDIHYRLLSTITDEGKLIQWKHNYRNQLIPMVGPANRSFFTADCQKGKMAFSGGILQKAYIAFNKTGAYTYENDTWKMFNPWNQKRWFNKNQPSD